jgi:hypothetical protein
MFFRKKILPCVADTTPSFFAIAKKSTTSTEGEYPRSATDTTPALRATPSAEGEF